MRIAPGEPGGAISRIFLIAALCGLVAALAVARYQARLEDRLDPTLSGTEIWVGGHIASLPQHNPDYLRFLFEPQERQAQLAGIPTVIAVRWPGATQSPAPGDAWRFRLRLQPPRGLLNFQGGDRERGLFAAGIGAEATVLDARRLAGAGRAGAGLDRLRGWIRQQIHSSLEPGEGRSLVLSLAIADRSELAPRDWSLLRSTGTGHLLAISGLHVGIAAMIGFWLTRLAVFLPLFRLRGRAGFVACCAGSMAMAVVYGALAAFPVSTIRALIMLACALALFVRKQAGGALGAWLMALLAVVAIDPFAPLSAGMWLSFGAVLALIACFSPRVGRPSRWTALPRAQLAVMVMVVPLGAFWFQAGSWLAFPANLVAIPWVSLLTVPLVFAGLGTLWAPQVSAVFFEAAATSAEYLHQFLSALSGLEAGRRWLTPDVGVVATVLALLGSLALLAPKGLGVRGPGLALLVIALLPRAPQLEEGAFSVEILDAGQGQSVLVRTRNHVMLYDTGPGGPDWSLYQGVVAPALAARGPAGPDLVAVSHADLDHAGGLAELLRDFPDVAVLFNSPHGGYEPCAAGQSWTWDRVRFRVLHPSPWLPYLGNDSSCVIEIDNGRQRALLSGDIGAAVESRLAESLPQYHLLTVPHHGSASSSSPTFIAATRPEVAVVSAAWGNRFGFPRDTVTARYRESGAAVLSTSECGAVRITFGVSGAPRLDTARGARPAPWRWSAGSCRGTRDDAPGDRA